ncbi:Poly(A) polymerase precursor,poly(A) polymerase I,poly(A) polymerase,Poly A polymerase head domain [Chlamydia serpentis]|uniref:Poly(A) polymerase I n=1 Tax=Chlamydia serpentis TaxID=1967782 RepID=A0A2R8FCC4_9CHLA|nr:polynucleotide adenylyltransferase PcnB [Chlamydia serpentis]SPN74073.1 Poly(A) polymerase precursor,poly(A) polymerase I,poly(A) polymerase,Poly A polymerase head domain [Chlamydia serpentis]
MVCENNILSGRGLALLKKKSNINLTPTIYSVTNHNIQLKDFSPQALLVIKTLRKAGYTAYIVGGCIRDLLLNTTPKDFDISTSAKPEEIKAIFKNCILVGKRFRLAHIRFSKQIIEVSTFRSGTDEDALITKDNLWGTPEEDVLRRDFTINGLFYDPEQEEIIDYTGGVNDLRNRYLRTIGDPFTRFKQDPVRMLRLLKILSRSPFTVEAQTQEALIACRQELTKSSQARVFEELIKMLNSGTANNFFRLLIDNHILEILFPYMAKAFRLNRKLEEQTANYLKALDNKLQQKETQYERHQLMAIFLFPIVNFNVRYKYQQHPYLSLTSVFDYIKNFLEQFFSDSFTSCSKKNFILTALILQMQYRLTPLAPTKKVLFFNKKLLYHTKFLEGLSLLEIRSIVYPKLDKVYTAWMHHYQALKYKKDSSQNRS